jgi:uncharacterized iron-regulated membrane protein
MFWLKHFPWMKHLLDPVVLLVIGIGSLALAAATLTALPFYLTRLPPDYFETPVHRRLSGPRWWIVRPAKNILGLILLVLGIAMLILPGQGILTILVALMLLEFPGKHRLVRRIVSIPGLLLTINRLRERTGRPPLRVGPDRRGAKLK